MKHVKISTIILSLPPLQPILHTLTLRPLPTLLVSCLPLHSVVLVFLTEAVGVDTPLVEAEAFVAHPVSFLTEVPVVLPIRLPYSPPVPSATILVILSFTVHTE